MSDTKLMILVDSHSTKKSEAVSISEYVSSELESNGYSDPWGCDEIQLLQASINDLEREAEKTRQAIGRLCEVLSKKDVLIADEIAYIVGSSMDHKFVETEDK